MHVCEGRWRNTTLRVRVRGHRVDFLIPASVVCSDWRVCLQKTEHGRFQGDAERFLSLMIVDHPPRTHANVNNPLQRHSTFRSSSSRLPLSVWYSPACSRTVPMLARARNVSCLSFAQNPHFSEELPAAGRI